MGWDSSVLPLPWGSLHASREQQGAMCDWTSQALCCSWHSIRELCAGLALCLHMCLSTGMLSIPYRGMEPAWPDGMQLPTAPGTPAGSSAPLGWDGSVPALGAPSTEAGTAYLCARLGQAASMPARGASGTAGWICSPLGQAHSATMCGWSTGSPLWWHGAGLA